MVLYLDMIDGVFVHTVFLNGKRWVGAKFSEQSQLTRKICGGVFWKLFSTAEEYCTHRVEIMASLTILCRFTVSF